VANLVERARLTWLWYVRFYKTVITLYLAWLFWPVVLAVAVLPFLLIYSWWSSVTTSGPVVPRFHTEAVSSTVDTWGMLLAAETRVSEVNDQAHQLFRRVEEQRRRNGTGESSSALSARWQKLRDYDPEPIVAEGLTHLAELRAVQNQLQADDKSRSAQSEAANAIERSNAWAERVSQELASQFTALDQIERTAFGQ
jgi:hypothetical protein